MKKFLLSIGFVAMLLFAGCNAIINTVEIKGDSNTVTIDTRDGGTDVGVTDPNVHTE